MSQPHNTELTEHLFEKYYIKHGKWKVKTNHAEKSANEILEKCPRTINMLPNDILKQVEQILLEDSNNKAAKAANNDVPIFELPINFINWAFEGLGYSVNAEGHMLTKRLADGTTKSASKTEVLTAILCEAADYRIKTGRMGDTKYFTPTTDDIKINMSKFYTQLVESNLLKIREAIKHDPKLDPHIICGILVDCLNVEGDREVNITILKHFLWCLKRHMLNLSTKNEIWLAIYGRQGIGKNHFTENVIVKAMGGYYVDTSLDKLSDMDREINKFHNNYLINFDELASNSATANTESMVHLPGNTIANIKNILTKDTITTRVMGGQDQNKQAKNFACMSTANLHIYDVVVDETGMRRFFEFASKQAANVHFDIEHAERMVPMLLPSIDENLPEGYNVYSNTEMWNKIVSIQKTYVAKSSITIWEEVCGVEYPASQEEEGDYDKISTKDLHELYLEYYEEENGGPKFSIGVKNFNKHLDGLTKTYAGRGGAKTVFYRMTGE